MKNSIVLFTVIISNFIFSQTYRFIYDVESRKDSTLTLITKENYHLDINGEEVNYYTRDFFIADSLIINNLPFSQNIKLNTSNIVSHKKGNNNFEEYDIIENIVLNLKTIDTQDWILTNEKKTINGLSIQKATTKWGGRDWIAWFTESIPFQEGPYKFHGLPGLIVELEDIKGNYKFSLVKSENLKNNYVNQFIDMSKKLSVSVNWEKYKSIKLSYYSSPIGFIRNNVGASIGSDIFLNDGTKVNKVNEREKNENLRSLIKKYNNPIDLNKSIKY